MVMKPRINKKSCGIRTEGGDEREKIIKNVF
jgi:hypothetical protein